MAAKVKDREPAVQVVPVNVKRKHESPSVLTEALVEIEPRVLRYFDRTANAGVIPQDALLDVRALIDLASKAEALAKALKAKLVEHKASGGQFASGKVAVQITESERASIGWKDEWAKASNELARLKGVDFNAANAEAALKLAYPTTKVTSVKIVVGD